MNYDLEKISKLLRNESWNWARTYLTVPHEYIVRDKCNMSDNNFLYIVHAQRDLGIEERWGKYNHPYLYIDGYKYWTMGDTFENTVILNRQKVFKEFDCLQKNEPYYTKEQSLKISQFISTAFSKPIFEIGFGYGNFVSESKITPEMYYGVEPSKKAVDYFRVMNVGYYKRVSNKSFEESTDKWKGASVAVIGLFGSPSYIMWQYLKILADNNHDYFLMFYKPEYVPTGLESMHHFRYSKEWLKKIFCKADIKEWDNYIIVSTRKIEIKPAYVQRGLFEI